MIDAGNGRRGSAIHEDGVIEIHADEGFANRVGRGRDGGML